MARTADQTPGDSPGGAAVGHQAQPCQMADALRGISNKYSEL